MKRRTLTERFWQKVDKSAGPNSCWLWTASTRTGSGYGQIRVDGKVWLAHRLAYALTHREIDAWEPDFATTCLIICHTCDNRRCVNPAHLWEGTLADNNRDRYLKNRP